MTRHPSSSQVIFITQSYAALRNTGTQVLIVRRAMRCFDLRRPPLETTREELAALSASQNMGEAGAAIVVAGTFVVEQMCAGAARAAGVRDDW